MTMIASHVMHRHQSVFLCMFYPCWQQMETLGTTLGVPNPLLTNPQSFPISPNPTSLHSPEILVCSPSIKKASVLHSQPSEPGRRHWKQLSFTAKTQI